jgi:hypothetical protein
VVVHLEEDTLENHGLLLAALRYECRVGRLTAAHGSSFGFRSHRFETIIPRVARQQGLFKVCAGARSGPSLNQLTGTLRNLGRHKSFEALRKAYPTLQPVPLR